jgi:signal transduction histidine kinase
MIVLLPRELRPYTNRRVFIALIGLILVAFTATAATVFTISTLLVYRQSSQVHNDTRVQTEELLASLGDAETSQRGYLLTGDAQYLAPYQAALVQVPRHLAAIKHEVNDASRQADIANLEPLVSQRLEKLAQTIQLYQAGDSAEAVAIVRSGVGQSLTNQIRTISSQILASETAQLTRDTSKISDLATFARDISIVAVVATLALSVLIYWLFLKAIQNEHRLDRAKDEFVSLASHQLRTPATGIKSILATLVAGDFGPLNERQDHFMRRALESNERELSIIEELLNVAKADAGRLVMHGTQFNLDELITTVADEQLEAIGKKHQILSYQPPLHAVPILGDEEKLYMAITNLLDNARKYTPESGNIGITVANRQGLAYVEVSDDGIGIEAHELDHIFDRFHRASDALDGNVDGTGLGLYLANRIAELHDGSLEVTSKIGKGTKFVMILPQGDRDAAQSATS